MAAGVVEHPGRFPDISAICASAFLPALRIVLVVPHVEKPEPGIRIRATCDGTTCGQIVLRAGPDRNCVPGNSKSHDGIVKALPFMIFCSYIL